MLLLHNICIDFEDDPINIDLIDENDNAVNNADVEGDIKRDIIAHLLYR